MQIQSNSNKQVKKGTGYGTALDLFGFSMPGSEQTERPDVLAPSYALKAVEPTITGEAFPRTMDNYRAYIEEYNIATGWENVDIENHNREVEIYFKRGKATELQKTYAAHFPKLHKDLNDRDYNEKADEVIKEHGPIIKKRVIQTIKYPTEQVFQNMLHMYNSQLIKRNQSFKRHNGQNSRPIQPIEVNSYLVTKLRRQNDVTSLPVCSKTVRNHRQRLEEAGVFMDYEFQGAQKGVKMYINPKILVVFDTKNNKIISAVNQVFTIWKGKILPDTNEITGAYKEEYKEKDGAEQPSFDKVSAPQTDLLRYKSTFYENTGSKLQNSPVGAAPENVKVEKTLSHNLRNRIMHPQELAESLAAKEFDNYSPIDLRYLEKVAFSRGLTDAEFKELVVQDLLKQSAKMWRNKTPYAGNWKKTINRWMDLMFVSHAKDPSGQYYPLGKEAILKSIPELRYRLEHARKWFLRNKTNPLFPYDYFDPTRKTSKERGFAFTKKAWQRRLRYMESLPAKKVKAAQETERRQTRLKDDKKFDTAIKRFIKNRSTLIQLEEYVQKNLPEHYYRDLPKILNERMAEAGMRTIIPLKLNNE